MANAENIKPYQFKPGQSGNPKGRGKGVQSWSTIVREMLEDEDLFDAIVDSKDQPDWWKNIKTKHPGRMIVAAMMTRAAMGDQKAATWLRKTGFGDMLDLTSDGKEIKTVAMIDMRVGAPVALVPVKEVPKQPTAPKKPKSGAVKKKFVVKKKAPAKKGK